METQLPLDIMSWIIAFLPICLLLVLMLGFNWGLTAAGPLAWFLVAFTGVLFFQAPPETIALESIKGIWDSLTTVLYIVIPAILIYEVLSVGDAFAPFRTELAKLSPHLLLQILALGWVLASFFQSIAGLGTPMAICAPLLVGLGVRPLIAVLIPLVGHAWGNTFALGVAWNCLKSAANMPAEIILPTAFLAAGFLWLVNLMGGLVICWLFAGFKGIKEGLPAVLLISLVHGGVQLALIPVTTEYNTIGAALCGFAVVYLLGKTRWYNKPSSLKSRVMQEGIEEIKIENSTSKISLFQAMVPILCINGSHVLHGHYQAIEGCTGICYDWHDHTYYYYRLWV
ncbi:MAG: L-lactate permease [Bacillota bacterium]